METVEKHQFLNFPLFLLFSTIKTPKDGLSEILIFGTYNYGLRLAEEAGWERALIQAVYVQSRRRDEVLPDPVLAILSKPEVEAAANRLGEAFNFEGKAEDFELKMMDFFLDDGVELGDEEMKTVMAWYGVRQAAVALGVHLCNHNPTVIQEIFDRLKSDAEQHKAAYGSLAWASLPMLFFRDVYRDPTQRNLDMLRGVAAVRSIVGTKRYGVTTKAHVQARMMGAKSISILNDFIQMAADDWARITARRFFDGLMLDMAARRFVVKLGARRRLYVSTAASDVETLAMWIGQSSNQRRMVANVERVARDRLYNTMRQKKRAA